MGRCLATAVLALAATCPLAVRAGTPAPSYADWFDRLPCVDRIGRCFDASIGGQPVEVIEAEAEYQRLHDEIRRINPNLREVYWQVREPLSGSAAMAVAVRANALGGPHVGEPEAAPRVTIHPLDGQRQVATRDLVANGSVRVNGQATVSRQNTLAQDTLPPGGYVFSIRYHGSLNWDRKSVLLTVR